MKEQVEVQIWKLDSDGPFLATARAIISTDWGDVIIDRLKAIRSKQGQVWIALPQTNYQKDGKTVYKDIIRLPLRLKKQIDDQVLIELGETVEK
jgi:hypothetical protein